MGEKISPDIIFFSILIISGFYYVGALQRRAAFVQPWHRHCAGGGERGAPGGSTLDPGTFASASTRLWVRPHVRTLQDGGRRMGQGQALLFLALGL